MRNPRRLPEHDAAAPVRKQVPCVPALSLIIVRLPDQSMAALRQSLKSNVPATWRDLTGNSQRRASRLTAYRDDYAHLLFSQRHHQPLQNFFRLFTTTLAGGFPLLVSVITMSSCRYADAAGMLFPGTSACRRDIQTGLYGQYHPQVQIRRAIPDNKLSTSLDIRFNSDWPP